MFKPYYWNSISITISRPRTRCKAIHVKINILTETHITQNRLLQLADMIIQGKERPENVLSIKKFTKNDIHSIFEGNFNDKIYEFKEIKTKTSVTTGILTFDRDLLEGTYNYDNMPDHIQRQTFNVATFDEDLDRYTFTQED